MRIPRRLLGLLVAVGIVAHLLPLILDGNRLIAAWSGGGDVFIYVGLARNILAGKGYTFAGLPTAFRAPLYPLLLAGLMWVSPGHYVVLLRVLQFFASVLTAVICARLAKRWFGEAAGLWAMAIALLLPTLVYFTDEVLTECFSALLLIVFLLYLDECLRQPTAARLLLLGAFAGLASLIRFNAIPIIFIAAAVLLWTASRQWKNVVLAGAACGVVLAPWLIHNYRVFHGKALYSTHGGYAAVEGILSPTGRASRGESAAVVKALGWANWLVETNTPRKPWYRDEVKLNAQAWQVARRLWVRDLWKLPGIGVDKVAAFWISTDQLTDLWMVSPRERIVRRIGVLCYWLVLAAALVGWYGLLKTHPNAAWAVLFYAGVLTALHLPLTMNTRLRVPLFDPLLAVLASGFFFRLQRMDQAMSRRSE